MTRFRNAAIVLGGGDLTGLGAIRSLGRAGITVYYLDEKKSTAIYSTYCNSYVTVPNISHNPEALKKALLQIKRCHAKEAVILFPGSDGYALSSSELITELPGYLVIVPKRDILEIVINKRQFYQSLLKEHVPHPLTFFPETVDDVNMISRDIVYPVYLKPAVSHQFTKWYGEKKGFVAHSQSQLIDYYLYMQRRGFDALIQEIVSGPPTNHLFLDGYMDRNSQPKAFFARRRIRMWPLAFGNSSVCVSVPASEVSEIKEILFRYLKSIQYQGIFSAEFKQDQRGQRFKLLEINSRTSAWFNTLSAKCGSNIMLTAYLDTIGQQVDYSEHYRAGIKWVFLKDELRAALTLIRKGTLGSQEWLSSFVGENDYASYAPDDRSPFVMSLIPVLKQLLPFLR